MALTREDLENDSLRQQYSAIREHVPLVPEAASAARSGQFPPQYQQLIRDYFRVQKED